MKMCQRYTYLAFCNLKNRVQISKHTKKLINKLSKQHKSLKL